MNMLDRASVQKAYAAWRMGRDMNEEGDDMPSLDEMAERSPSERKEYYGILRNRALRFALVIHIAIDDNVLGLSELGDIQMGMAQLREWYYGLPRRTH